MVMWAFCCSAISGAGVVAGIRIGREKDAEILVNAAQTILQLVDLDIKPMADDGFHIDRYCLHYGRSSSPRHR